MSNRKDYDAGFCGNLPVHNINLIQPHGSLLVLNRDLQVVQASENIKDVTGLEARQVVNTRFSEYVKAQQYQALLSHLAKGLTRIPINFSFTIEDKSVETVAFVYVKEQVLIIELEILPTDQPTFSSFTDVYQHLKFAMAAIESAPSIEALSEIAITELKKLSGFDKIMMYRFDKKWNGTVIAETMEPGMESYLGLVFPASDIPKQARHLYLSNPYRLIPNREYIPVKLYPLINPVTSTFIDLSDVAIRAVPSVHLEYLKNMEVSASMSTRIMTQDRQLWGLISCHHRTARYLNYEVCTIFELMSSIISSRIVTLENKQEYDYHAALLELHAQLAREVYRVKNLVDGLLSNETTLLKLLNADGVAIHFDKRFETRGITPTKKEILDLIYWLKSKEITKLFYEDSLSAAYETAGRYADTGSGIMIIPIHPQSGDYIIFFRQEVIQKINWGGNPADAIQFEGHSQVYHPRNSFRIWKETVAHTSLPWQSYEIHIAGQFRNFILEYIVST